MTPEERKAFITERRRRIALGDKIERFVKPFAKAIHHPCLQPDDTLRPGSPCDKIKRALNRLTE